MFTSPDEKTTPFNENDTWVNKNCKYTASSMREEQEISPSAYGTRDSIG